MKLSKVKIACAGLVLVVLGLAAGKPDLVVQGVASMHEVLVEHEENSDQGDSR